jgi:hypothetical protein
MRRQCPDVMAGVGSVEPGIGGGDSQRAAGKHCIARIDHQVNQHLFDLAWVGPDWPKQRIQLDY